MAEGVRVLKLPADNLSCNESAVEYFTSRFARSFFRFARLLSETLPVDRERLELPAEGGITAGSSFSSANVRRAVPTKHLSS